MWVYSLLFLTYDNWFSQFLHFVFIWRSWASCTQCCLKTKLVQTFKKFRCKTYWIFFSLILNSKTLWGRNSKLIDDLPNQERINAELLINRMAGLYMGQSLIWDKTTINVFYFLGKHCKNTNETPIKIIIIITFRLQIVEFAVSSRTWGLKSLTKSESIP